MGEQADLFSSSDFLLKVMNSLKVMVAVIDKENWELVGADQAFFSFFGKKELADFKEDYSCISESFELTGKGSRFTHNDPGCDWILSILDTEETHKVMIKGRAFQVDATMIDDTYVVATFTDITETMQEEKEREQHMAKQLQEYVQRASSMREVELVASIALPALVINEKNRLTAYNNAFLSLFDMFEDKETIEQIKTKQYDVGERFLFKHESISKNSFIDWKEDRLGIECDEAGTIEVPIGSQRCPFYLYISKIGNQHERYLVILHRV